MKTAFLIMAHDKPRHLAKLVKILNRDWTGIFMHIDNKCNIEEFKRLIPKDNRVVFIDAEERTDVIWGGFSQVDATINLLRTAFNSGEGFTRFCLLSGSDFPIKTMKHIRAQFDTEKEFIRIDRRVGYSDANTHCKNVRFRHFIESTSLGKYSGVIPRKVYNHIMLCQGSQWWALTRDCVKYIINYIENSKDYIRFHKQTLAPDEIFCHSIVKSSPFALKIVHDFEKVTSYCDYLSSNEHGCTYIDWNAWDVSLPKVLTMEDYDNLINSTCLFARKFDKNQSLDLMKMFEKNIWLND